MQIILAKWQTRKLGKNKFVPEIDRATVAAKTPPRAPDLRRRGCWRASLHDHAGRRVAALARRKMIARAEKRRLGYFDANFGRL